MSLKKIAEMVGVSPSTVSRVLNDSSSTCASEEVKARIWAAAHEINYIPNASARNLKRGEKPQQKPLSFLIFLARAQTLLQDPFFRDLYRELEIDIFQNGLSLTATLTPDEIEKLGDLSYDGMIVLGRCSKSQLRRLSELTRNLVGIWRNPMDYQIDEVVCDGREAALLAVSYLISKGHSRIGYIGDCSYESRYIGYTEALIRHQLPLDYSCVISTDQTETAGREAMLRLAAADPPTAILCANDSTALGVLSALQELAPSRKRKAASANSSLPDQGHNATYGHGSHNADPVSGENPNGRNVYLSSREISVISIDDTVEAQNTTPMLTAVHIPCREMAHMAVVLLTDRIRRGHTEPMRLSFPCRLAERDSVYSI